MRRGDREPRSLTARRSDGEGPGDFGVSSASLVIHFGNRMQDIVILTLSESGRLTRQKSGDGTTPRCNTRHAHG